MIQNLINHISLVLDASGSMSTSRANLVKVFNNEIAYLKTRSVELNQETRVSVYTFRDRKVTCIVYDMDVMRMSSIEPHYHTGGQTNLIDANLKAIEDNKKLPELYGDHAFLMYCLTDGAENSSINRPSDLLNAIAKLPDNWTVVALVPDSHSIYEAKKFGFPANNISVWNVNGKDSLENVGKEFRSSMDTYFTNRSQGIRSTKNFFNIDIQKLNKAVINKNNLNYLDNSKFFRGVNTAPKAVQSKDLVINNGFSYSNGVLFYELVKTETIQPVKEIIIKNRKSNHLYGGKEARNILGLPSTEVQVKSVNHPDYEIYIQSTAPNRNIIPNQKFLIQK